MNSRYSKTSHRHRLILNLTDKIGLRGGETSVALSNLSIYYSGKSIKNLYKTSKFKISAPKLNSKLELTDEYSISNIQDYFEYLREMYETFGDNSSMKMYIYKNESRITFKIKKAYYLKMLTSETM